MSLNARGLICWILANYIHILTPVKKLQNKLKWRILWGAWRQLQPPLDNQFWGSKAPHILAQQRRGHLLTACNATPPATPHCLQNPKFPPGGPKMAEGVWKGVYPQVFGCSKQLSLNKFFDQSTPSMRKGYDGGEKKILISHSNFEILLRIF